MKKSLFLLGVLLISAYNGALAQDEEDLFSIGPKLGVNFSNFSDVDNAETKAGLRAGLFGVYSFQEHFGVSFDLLYSVEGAQYTAKSTENNMTTSYEYKSTLNYLRVPILANVFFRQYGDRFRPKIHLGPSFGFLMSAKNKIDYTVSDGTTVISSNSTTDKDGFKSMDFGAVIGAGFNYRLASAVWLNFDLDYYMGASDITESNTTDAKNMGPSVSLGLAFGL